MTAKKYLRDIKWDVKKERGTYSNIYTPRLIQWILKGVIKKGEVLVWRSGFSGWIMPEKLPELIPYFNRYAEKQKLLKEKRLYPDRKKQIESILVIDDEKETCVLFDKLLEREYDVTAVTTGRGGINSVKKNKPDLVFLDLKLKNMYGLSVLTKIKKISPETTVIMISAHGDAHIKKEAKQCGAFAFLDKPIYIKQIWDIIKKVSKS